MNTERLLRIAEIVEAVPPEKFNIGEWYLSCKSVGCAIGWAAQAPDIAALGLTVSINGPEYDGLDGFEAVAAFIEDDTDSVASSLFAPWGYFSDRPSPTFVAECIRHVVNGGTIPHRWKDPITAD